MKTFLIFTLSIGLVIVLYWQMCMNFKVKVTVINESKMRYDSINVYVFPDKHFTFYDIKPQDTLIKVFEYKNFSYPKGEHGAAGAGAYKDDYYYACSDGLIDTPYAFLQDEYNFYVWDNGIHPVKGVKPMGDFAKKRKIKNTE